MNTSFTKYLRSTRTVLQWFFLFLVAGIGIRFGMFVNSVESGTAAPLVSRPPGVEGFLPIGALASFKYWLFSGKVHQVHPAALVIFAAIVLMSLLAKKSFCSWLCPVGTLSEVAYKAGRRLFGRNLMVWRWLDFVLRSIKYLLLFLFIKLIVLDMPLEALEGFLDAPYWAISDVKMLHFFSRMSLTSIIVLSALLLFSIFYKMFWCRYLCPYGALLGLASLLSPFKIRRDTSGCTGCKKCSAVCPSDLPVHTCKTVSSPECSGCLNCVTACPEQGVLAMNVFFGKKIWNEYLFPALLVLIFVSVIAAGILSGNWQTSLTYDDYRELVPVAAHFDH